MGVKEHREKAKGPANFAIVTVSDTRNEKTDESGKLVREMAGRAGHRVVAYRIVKDEAAEIENAVRTFIDSPEVNAIVVNGGTGIGRRDVTVEAVRALFEKKLDGFGELFRQLSYQDIGAAAMMSRATAGIAKGKVVFLLPGSTNAVKLAMERLILPEVPHLVWETNR